MIANTKPHVCTTTPFNQNCINIPVALQTRLPYSTLNQFNFDNNSRAAR